MVSPKSQLTPSGYAPLDMAIQGLLGVRKPADPFEEQSGSLDFWDDRNFSTAARKNPKEIVADPIPFNSDRWMNRYQNGQIPASAMAPLTSQGNGYYARPDVAEQFEAMFAAAKADGVQLYVTSQHDSYRSLEWQTTRASQVPGLAATPGHSPHGWGIAVDINLQRDPKTYDWLKKHGKEYGFSQPMSYEPWHWQYGTGPQGTGGVGRRPDKHEKHTPAQEAAEAALMTAGPTQVAAGLSAAKQGLLGAVSASPFTLGNSLLRTINEPPEVIKTNQGKKFAGDMGDIKYQLYQGFMDAGRKDLANMVETKAFDKWIAKESGWNPRIRGEGLGPSRRVYGLFQFMDFESRPWVNAYVEGGEFTATPYQQAQFVAEHFGHLTPAKIRRYAQEIDEGSYEGWG